VQKYAKFESGEIKDGIIGLLEALDDDLEAADYTPSSGENSVDEALLALEESISDFETSDEEDDDTGADDDDDDTPDDDDDEIPPVKS
jgi:hypothetical protein